MKTIITACLLGLSLMAGQAIAADNPQQNKMAVCNKDAGEKKGDERKMFMKSCLGAKKASQQDKMKMCNKDATGKKGDERKAYMKDCLSK